MNKTLKKVLCAVMALAMLFALTACKKDEDKSGGSGSSSIEGVFEKYCELYEEGADVEALMKEIISPYNWDEDGEELMNMVEEFKDMPDMMKEIYGEDAAVSVEILSEEDPDEEYLEAMKENYKEAGYEIEDAKSVTAEMTMKGEFYEHSGEETMTAVKIDGSWYLCVD